MSARIDVAVLIPCFNEAGTIGDVVRQALAELPEARVFVYDNGSTDGTAAIAAAAGAQVRFEPRKGKGSVVRRMFRDIAADVYVLVDGDNTYELHGCAEWVQRLSQCQLDMVIVARTPQGPHVHRPGHDVGNRFLTGIVNFFFDGHVRDMLSGYRILSHAFVKSFPALSEGFELETELMVHALELRMPVEEVEAPYRSRPSGSHSKLHTIADGLRILRMIGRLVRSERPLLYFSSAAALIGSASILIMIPVFIEYHATGLVPRFPTAILSVGMMLTSLLCLTTGMLLDAISAAKQEIKRMLYLQNTRLPEQKSLGSNSRAAV